MITVDARHVGLAARTRMKPAHAIGRGSIPSVTRIPLVARFALLLTAAILLMMGGRIESNATVINNEYKLGPMDQIRLRVFEWRAAKDEVYEWAALNSEYAIGPSGRISLPLIGEVAAAGLSVDDLAKSLGQRLQTRMGLTEVPDIAVEVSKYRPFYLVGTIEKPGEYAYRPGMTVLQAVAVAGGLTKLNDIAGGRIERELIQTRGDLMMFSQEFNTLLARRARLDSEVKGIDSTVFPASLSRSADQDTSIAVLLQQEENIFKSRRELFDNQVATLEQLTRYLQAQTKSLEDQIGTHDQQTALVKTELASITSLVSKGYSTQPRKLGLQRNVVQLEGDRLRLQDSLLRVNGELSRTNIALLDLHSKRVTEATAELRDVQSRLETIARRSDTAERLLTETETIAPLLIAERTRDKKREPIYTIVRLASGKGSEISASEVTAIEPGDTIKVELPRSELTLKHLLINNTAEGNARFRLDPTTEAAQPESVSRPLLRNQLPRSLVPSSARLP